MALVRLGLALLHRVRQARELLELPARQEQEPREVRAQTEEQER
jgi:hypothetical protein